MTSLKSDQQMTLPLPPCAKISNISIAWNNGSANTWQILRTSLPTLLLCRHRKCKFLVFYSLVYHVSECEWNFEFYENSVNLPSVKLSKKPSLYFRLYQLLFEHLFGKFISVSICYSWQDFIFEIKLMFLNFCFHNFYYIHRRFKN